MCLMAYIERIFLKDVGDLVELNHAGDLDIYVCDVYMERIFPKDMGIELKDRLRWRFRHLCV